MGKIKILFVVFGILAAFLVSFMGNVYLHELGHYAAADHFGLNPEIKWENIEAGWSFRFETKAVAYTEFDKSDSDIEMFVVALTGPLVNLVLGLIFLSIYVLKKDNVYVRMLVLTALVPCIFSFLMNVLPFNGTDGEFILNLFN